MPCCHKDGRHNVQLNGGISFHSNEPLWRWCKHPLLLLLRHLLTPHLSLAIVPCSCHPRSVVLQPFEDLPNSRIIQGKLSLQVRPVHLVPVISVAINTVQPTANVNILVVSTVLPEVDTAGDS